MPAVTCPFCGIFCGDLAFENGRVDTSSCAKAETGFARPVTVTEHSVGGRKVPLAEAVDAAAAILRAARQPLFTGLGTDLLGLQALLGLADSTGGVLDRWQSSPQLANLGVQQRVGCWIGTFAEVSNRADQILIVGRDPAPFFPRLFERLVHNPTPLYRKNAPQVTYLGPSELRPADRAHGGTDLAADITVPANQLYEALLVLAAEAEGRKLPESVGTSLPLAQLMGLAQRFKDGAYGSIIWDVGAFPPVQAELMVETILRIVRGINLTTRCSSLPLGATDNAMGVMQAALWQAGWPMRIGFGEGFPRHDAYLYNAERMLSGGDADALVWVAALSAAPPPATSVPTIAVVAPDTILATPAAVEFRVGIPGVDHAGTVVRADGVIAVPLGKTRDSGLPSTATIVNLINERLGGEP